MPQLVLIKESNTPTKKVGDIVDVFDDAHVFTDHEQSVFYIEYVAGFESALELKKTLRQNHYEIRHVYRLPIGNEWSLDPPEEKEVWREPGGRWLDYSISTKFKLNYYALSEADRTALALEEISLGERIELLKRCENRIKSHPENLVDVPELNRSVIG